MDWAPTEYLYQILCKIKAKWWNKQANEEERISSAQEAYNQVENIKYATEMVEVHWY